MPDRPDRDLPRVYTPDTDLARIVLVAIMLAILAGLILIAGMQP